MFSKETIKNISKNAQFFIFIVIVFAIPFTKRFLPYAMLLWVLSGLINIRRLPAKTIKNNILLVFPLVFYLLHVFGLIYTENIDRGLIDLQVKLSILFIPFLSLFTTNKVIDNHKVILKFFVLGNFLASIICIVYALDNCIQLDSETGLVFESSVWPEGLKGYSFFQLINSRVSYLSYNYLSLIHHPTYFSIYILFSIITIIYIIRSANNNKNIGYYLLIAYFSLFLWLLGSRAVFLTYLISIFSFLLIIILKFRKYLIGVSILVIGIPLFIIIFSKTPINKNIKETINLWETKQLNTESDIRLWTWKAGFEVLKENFWLGAGTGDINQKLQEKYEKYNLIQAKERNYNVHNQYLDLAIKFGFVGLSVFLIWMFYTLYITIKQKQFLFFYFMLIMMINFFFEVMLSSIAGVSFFAFFYFLLYARYNGNSPEN